MRKTEESRGGREGKEKGRGGKGREGKERGRGGEGGEIIRSSSVDTSHGKFQSKNTTKDHFITIKEATDQENTRNKQNV